MCSETGKRRVGLQSRDQSLLKRQCDLAVEPRAEQTGGRIAAAEHVGAGVGQGPGIGRGIFEPLAP